MSHRAFFEHAGHLLYAVIAADGDPDEREKKAVHQHIYDLLRPVDVSGTQIDSASWLLAKIAFDEAVHLKLKPLSILESFDRFSEEPQFTRTAVTLRKELWRMLHQVAASHKGVNDAESSVLRRLQLHF